MMTFKMDIFFNGFVQKCTLSFTNFIKIIYFQFFSSSKFKKIYTKSKRSVSNNSKYELNAFFQNMVNHIPILFYKLT